MRLNSQRLNPFQLLVVLVILFAGIAPASVTEASPSPIPNNGGPIIDHVSEFSEFWLNITGNSAKGDPMPAKQLAKLVRSLRASGYEPQFPAQLFPDGSWMLLMTRYAAYTSSGLFLFIVPFGFYVDGLGCVRNTRTHKPMPGYQCIEVA